MSKEEDVWSAEEQKIEWKDNDSFGIGFSGKIVFRISKEQLETMATWNDEQKGRLQYFPSLIISGIDKTKEL